MLPQPLAILHQPLMQALPFTDQRFMGDLGAVFVQGDQARLSQRVEHAAQLRCFLRVAHEFGQSGSATGVFGALTSSVKRKKSSRASSCCVSSS